MFASLGSLNGRSHIRRQLLTEKAGQGFAERVQPTQLIQPIGHIIWHGKLHAGALRLAEWQSQRERRSCGSGAWHF